MYATHIYTIPFNGLKRDNIVYKFLEIKGQDCVVCDFLKNFSEVSIEIGNYSIKSTILILF